MKAAGSPCNTVPPRPEPQLLVGLGPAALERRDRCLHIFGSGPGFCDRLGRIVRDELGLVYTIGGGMTDSADVVPGLFRVCAGTTPDEADRVIVTITEQIRAMHAGSFSDYEVARARRYLTGAWVFDYQSTNLKFLCCCCASSCCSGECCSSMKEKMPLASTKVIDNNILREADFLPSPDNDDFFPETCIDIGTEGDRDSDIVVNEVYLSIIVKNLIDNAIRHTPVGGRIDLSVTAD